MLKLFFLLLFVPFAFCNNSASFELQVGGRWDRVRTTGSANNVVASFNDILLLGPLKLVGLNRKMEDMNLFHVGGKISLRPYHVFLVRGSIDYGIFFTDAVEVFNGALVNQPSTNLLFIENRNAIEHKQFSLDLIGEGGFLTNLTNNFQMGFTVGYGYFLLRMSESNRVEADGFLGHLLFYYRLGKNWRIDLELEALFFGHYDQIITFAGQTPQSGQISPLMTQRGPRTILFPVRTSTISVVDDEGSQLTIESGRVKTDRVWGYGGTLGLTWLFGSIWALTGAYQLRNIETPRVHTTNFGGTAKLDSFWSAQKASLILSYSY